MSQAWKYFEKHQSKKPLTPEESKQVETRIEQMMESEQREVSNRYSTPLNWQ